MHFVMIISILFMHHAPFYKHKGTLPNYVLKISVIMTLSLGPPPSPPLSVMAKVADSPGQGLIQRNERRGG